MEPWQMQILDRDETETQAAFLSFAQKYPGSLTARFLSNCKAKLRGGRNTKTKHLKDVSGSSWVQARLVSLAEIGDQREAQTLASVSDLVNAGDMSRAMDIVVSRRLALLQAKEKRGSWQKASKMELIPAPGRDMGPTGAPGLL